MVLYRRCSKPELIKFAHDRGLHVRSSGAQQKRPLKRDLILALRAADNDRSFRFLGLPPELRDMVYREVLTIQSPSAPGSSPKCHPQILRTSKAVNQEASGILYGFNVIEIIVQPSGIFAHGMQCGTYLPQTPETTDTKLRKIGDLVWPGFPRRVRSVKATNFNMLPGQGSRTEVPNPGTLHSILFSLCTFLQDSHALRSLTVDLVWFVDRCINMGQLETFDDYLGAAVYPLRLIDEKRVDIEVLALEPTIVSLPIIPNPIATQLAQNISSGSIITAVRQLQACMHIDYQLFTSVDAGAARECHKLLLSFISILDTGVIFITSLLIGVFFLNRAILDRLGEVRCTWDNLQEGAPATLKKQLNGITMFGVELQRAQRETGTR